MPVLVANWKMHGSRAAAGEYAFAVNAALELAPAGLEVVFCPPFPYLAAAKASLPQNARLVLGAQDCHAAREGAFTGEVAAVMLKDMGCDYVILGHSERRAAGETDMDVAAKAASAIEAGLTPILCIGEEQKDYEKGITMKILDTQLAGLKKLPPGAVVVAYEPVWAIGSGKTPKSAEIISAHRHIKSTLGSATPVLYGGSVKPANLREILGIEGVDGALVGGASLTINDTKSLIETAAKGK